jgi:hypothetical protein
MSIKIKENHNVHNVHNVHYVHFVHNVHFSYLCESSVEVEK